MLILLYNHWLISENLLNALKRLFPLCERDLRSGGLVIDLKDAL